MIFHITTQKDWTKAQKAGEYTALSLQAEEFIHCSTAKQVVDTANLFFKGQKDLVLLCIDENKLTSECRYEKPATKNHDPNAGQLFPHIYGPIKLPAIASVVDFPANVNGHFQLPAEIGKLI